MAAPIVRIPKRVRFRLYVSAAVATPLVTYLAAKGFIGLEEVALATAYVGLLNLLASDNVSETPPERRPVREVE